MKNIIMAKGGLRGKIFLTAGLVHITCALVTLTTFIYGEYVRKHLSFVILDLITCDPLDFHLL